jgi:hypothetical protein
LIRKMNAIQFANSSLQYIKEQISFNRTEHPNPPIQTCKHHTEYSKKPSKFFEESDCKSKSRYPIFQRNQRLFLKNLWKIRLYKITLLYSKAATKVMQESRRYKNFQVIFSIFS